MAAFTALALGSAAVSIYGQIKGGNAEKKAGQAEEAAARDAANLLDWNAAVADLQGKDAITRGQEEEQRIRMSLRQVIGTQRATRAASNVDIGFGSAVDIQADAARMAELDVLTTKNNAAREAWGFAIEGEDLRRQAAITRKSGANAAAAGRARQSAAYVGAFGTVLSTGANYLQGKYGGRGKPKKPGKVGSDVYEGLQ